MKVWKYGDDVNTDMLFPGKYTYTCSTPDEIKAHLLEDLDPEFASGVRPGDIVLAGKNFGCGSSREQPVVGLKAVGVRAIVAQSFSRIFFRAAINQGFLAVESPDAVRAFQDGDPVEVDPERGIVRIDRKSFALPKLPQAVMDILAAGGLLEYTRKKLSLIQNNNTNPAKRDQRLSH